MRGQRLKPKFNEEEDQYLDKQINSIVETLTLVRIEIKAIDHKKVSQGPVGDDEGCQLKRQRLLNKKKHSINIHI